MSGGMEDAHEQDRQERFDAELRQSSNQSNNSNNYEQGQLIDFQAMIMANNPMALVEEFASADERFEAEYRNTYEESVQGQTTNMQVEATAHATQQQEEEEEAIDRTAADLMNLGQAIIDSHAITPATKPSKTPNATDHNDESESVEVL
jgi:hypothetical protein